MAFGKLLDKTENLKAASDYFFKAATLPNTTAKTSSEIRCNDGAAGVAIVAKAITDIASGALKAELLHSDESGDGSPTTTLLLDVTAIAFSAGDELFRFVPNRLIGAYGKVRLTTTADKSAETVSVFVTGIANRSSVSG